MISRDFPQLDKAIEAESWRWLNDYLPDMAEAVEAEVQSNAKPAEIRRHVMRKTQRDRLAARCEQAAAHIARNGSG